MAAAPEIPGFYYDVEKRKYFKIDAHGPSSNPYSAGNIAKRRKAESQSLKQFLEASRVASQLSSLRPIQRFTNSSFSVRGYMNSREIGTKTSSDDKDCLHAKLLRKQRLWEIKSNTESELENLTCFALDEYTGDAVLGTQGGLVSAMSTHLPAHPSLLLSPPQTAVTRFTSLVTSISLSTNSDEKTLVCCSLGNAHNSGTIHIGKFTRAEDRQYGLEVHAVMKPREQQSLFCTTISRYASDLFAVGAENVIFVAGGLREQRPMLNIRSNCLAVEFLGEHTLAAGRRNGDIRVYDFRGQPKLHETGLFVNHVSSVTHMRQVEDHFLVVAGLENSLQMYDLRHIKSTVSANGKRETAPVIKYSGHSNSVTFRMGLDISSNSSILAAAGEDGYVRLWSVTGGQRIHARVSEFMFQEPVVGLQFSQEDDGLWIAGQDVEYWSTT